MQIQKVSYNNVNINNNQKIAKTAFTSKTDLGNKILAKSESVGIFKKIVNVGRKIWNGIKKAFNYVKGKINNLIEKYGKKVEGTKGSKDVESLGKKAGNFSTNTEFTQESISKLMKDVTSKKQGKNIVKSGKVEINGKTCDVSQTIDENGKIIVTTIPNYQLGNKIATLNIKGEGKIFLGENNTISIGQNNKSSKGNRTFVFGDKTEISNTIITVEKGQAMSIGGNGSISINNLTLKDGNSSIMQINTGKGDNIINADIEINKKTKR